MVKKLRGKFIRIAMLAVISVTVVLSLIINVANFISVNTGLTETLEMICENRGTIPPMPRGDHPFGDKKPDGKFSPETPYATRYFVLRYSADGTLLAADLKNIAAVTEEDTDPYLKTALRHGVGYGFTGDYKYRVLQDESGEYMAVFLDCSREVSAITKIALLSLFSTVFCVGVVYVAVLLFSRRAIDPVVKASERQKQFITDASHELKTPITVISTSLKLLEMETGEQKWINKAKGQTDKLTALVNDLVTLSRMDEEQSPLHMQDFPVSDAVSETAESFRALAADRGHALEIAVASAVTYRGDEYAVRQLCSILLDNACKYTAADAPIRFTLEKGKKGIVIRTENACDNISEQDTKMLFDRFYRADPSRNAATGGFGIGLSIARSIAEGHGGSIKAEKSGDDLIITAALH